VKREKRKEKTPRKYNETKDGNVSAGCVDVHDVQACMICALITCINSKCPSESLKIGLSLNVKE